MNNIAAVFIKELKSYFLSPLAYIVAGVFLVVCSFFFVMILYYMQQYPSVTFDYFYQSLFSIILLMTPVITMRLVAPEKRSGTLELLMTAPITEFQLIAGKFLAAMTLYIGMLLMTIPYPLTLIFLSSPDMGPLLSGYLALLLLGAAFFSVGLFTSTLTKNQIISAVISLVLLLLILLVADGKVFAQSQDVKKVFEYIAISDHFDELTKGVIDTRRIVYFLSFTALFIFLSIRSLETSRWK